MRRYKVVISVYISHYRGKTAGPICSKFCTKINLGPETIYILLLIGADFGWDWLGRGGGREGRCGTGRGCLTFI